MLFKRVFLDSAKFSKRSEAISKRLIGRDSLKNKYFTLVAGDIDSNIGFLTVMLWKKGYLDWESAGQERIKCSTLSISRELQSLQCLSKRGMFCHLPFSISRSNEPSRNLLK